VYSVRYKLAAPAPTTLATNRALFLDVAVENAGDAPLPHEGPRPLTLACRWRAAHGAIAVGDSQHVALPRSLLSGERAVVELPAEPPARPGAYTLLVELVEEGVAWLSERGVAPLEVPVAVVEPPPAPRRVALVSNDVRLNDSLGNHLVEQLRFFAARGDDVLALVENIDERQPREVRAMCCRVRLADLQSADVRPLARRGAAHFAASELCVVNYSTHYALAEAARLAGGQVILDYHGVTPPELWGNMPGLEDLVRGQEGLKVARYADWAITHSSYTRDELVAATGFPPERVSVIPCVVPLESFRPGGRDAALVERYGLGAGPALLYVGRMAANKRVVDLVRALPAIRARFPHARLLLVGDKSTPPYNQVVGEATAEAEALGVAEAVTFTGQLPLGELVALYQTCELFVTASRHEGFCIPVVEALACGTPVVGARATALPETIGEGGLTFSPGDHLALAGAVCELLDKHESSAG
jgi:glycosyltransferase involved in cell wall biosynthesis